MEKLRRTGGAGRNQQMNFGWKDSAKMEGWKDSTRNYGNYGLRRSVGKISLVKE